MKRGQYLRLTSYIVPFPSPFSSTLDLETTAMLSSVLWTMEGWLQNHLFIGSRIYLAARIKEGKPCSGTFRSEPITRLEGQYALAYPELLHFVRVPPSRGESFLEFA